MQERRRPIGGAPHVLRDQAIILTELSKGVCAVAFQQMQLSRRRDGALTAGIRDAANRAVRPRSERDSL